MIDTTTLSPEDLDAMVGRLRAALWSSWGAGRRTKDWPDTVQLRAALEAALTCEADQ